MNDARKFVCFFCLSSSYLWFEWTFPCRSCMRKLCVFPFFSVFVNFFFVQSENFLFNHRMEISLMTSVFHGISSNRRIETSIVVSCRNILFFSPGLCGFSHWFTCFIYSEYAHNVETMPQ